MPEVEVECWNPPQVAKGLSRTCGPFRVEQPHSAEQHTIIRNLIISGWKFLLSHTPALRTVSKDTP